MKVLVDTNVILDVLLKRNDLYEESFEIFRLAEQGKITGHISSSAITDIFFLVHRVQKDSNMVYRVIEDLTAVFTIIPVFEMTIKKALALRWKDFEDAVQYSAAKENGIDCIVTRNKGDYDGSILPCVNPADFPAFLAAAGNSPE